MENAIENIEHQKFTTGDPPKLAGVTTIHRWTDWGYLSAKKDSRGWRHYDRKSALDAVLIARQMIETPRKSRNSA